MEIYCPSLTNYQRLKIITPEIIIASDNIKNKDLSFMSNKHKNQLMKSVKNINDAATVLPNMYKINENVKLLALDYKPIRDEVRFIELKINKSKRKIKIPERKKTPVITPKKREVKKDPLILDQKILN